MIFPGNFRREKVLSENLVSYQSDLSVIKRLKKTFEFFLPKTRRARVNKRSMCKLNFKLINAFHIEMLVKHRSSNSCLVEALRDGEGKHRSAGAEKEKQKARLENYTLDSSHSFIHQLPLGARDDDEVASSLTHLHRQQKAEFRVPTFTYLSFIYLFTN